jgi:hypothetical protein
LAGEIDSRPDCLWSGAGDSGGAGIAHFVQDDGARTISALMYGMLLPHICVEKHDADVGNLPSRGIMHGMKNLGYTLVLVAAVIACAWPAAAQQKRLSPHENISTVVEGNRVTIVYGRPYTKDPKTGVTRKIWGGLVPYGKIWRTGADEATLLITQKPIELGGAAIPAGAYTLWTLPTEGKTTLIVNRQIGQWGISPRDPKQTYDEALDVARIDLKKDVLKDPVDQFTMSIEANPAGGGVLKLTWENTRYSTTFKVKK